MQYSEAFRLIMRDRRATQVSLAEAVGVKGPSVAGMLAKSDPSLHVMHRYLSKLGYRVALVPDGAFLPEGSYLLDPKEDGDGAR